MPLRLDISRKFSARSDRVKSVDFHPTEPWILASLYNGHVYIWNYKTQTLLKSFEVSDLPVRTAKFIARKNWIITGSDDMQISIYNYNTLEKVKSFEAHSDYIRNLAVHPTQPFVLSSSDDMQIKLWDWDKNWQNVQVFEGHTHYVMMIVFNPKDPNTFASASLDRTIKVWGLGSSTPNFTLEGHEKGVNCIEYFNGGEKPYLVSGADDRSVKVWDYQNKTCVQTLEGHTNNVSVVCFHPTLPIIISGSEDGTVRIWHANTYRLEKTLNYGMERVWAISYLKGSNKVAIGYDDGATMIKFGSEEPAVSMDHSGKIVWAKHNEIQTVDLRTGKGIDVEDGERMNLAVKDLGSCEIYPQSLEHNSNGHFIVVCGDGEYIIYTALGLRNRSFGSGLEFVWATGIKKDRGVYGVRESTSKVKIFKNFKETKLIRPSFTVEGIFGGILCGVRSGKFVTFYDWEGNLVRRIDVNPKSVVWSASGDFVAICCDSSFYILKFNQENLQAALNEGGVGEEGVENAFELLHELNEKVRTAHWAGDCFVYTNSNNRLNYCVGGEVFTISHLDRQMYLLGYIPRDNRLYLVDKNLNLTGYTLNLSVVNYQTAILRNDFEAAEELLPSIPNDQRDKIAHFLESQGHKEEALRVSNDPDHKFELAVNLGKLELAHEIAKTADSPQKWRQLSDLALSNDDFTLAEQCMLNADDVNGLLLLYTSLSNGDGLEKLADLAVKEGRQNTAFMCFFLTGQLSKCLDVLCTSGRIPEAAFFARTYVPAEVSKIVSLWREDLIQVNVKAAESLADPMEYENLFPDIKVALKAEEMMAKERENKVPASSYLEMKHNYDRDLIEEIKALEDGLDLNDDDIVDQDDAEEPVFGSTSDDAGEVDIGEVDAGEVDTGEVDIGEVDVGEVDVGAVEVGGEEL